MVLRIASTLLINPLLYDFFFRGYMKWFCKFNLCKTYAKVFI